MPLSYNHYYPPPPGAVRYQQPMEGPSMTGILKPSGSGSRRPPSHPSSGRHCTSILVTPTRAPAQGSATRQRPVLVRPPIDPIDVRYNNATLDKIHGRGQCRRQGRRFTRPVQHQVPDAGGRILKLPSGLLQAGDQINSPTH
jgi:hypothetical protein